MISKTFYHFYDERITTIIQNIQKNVHPAGMLSNTVWSDLDSILYEIMHKAAVRTLIVEMHECRKNGRLPGSTPEKEYLAFVELLGIPDYREDILNRYTGLAELLENIEKNQYQFWSEFFSRLKGDSHLIDKMIGNEEKSLYVESIKANVSDLHLKGRMVIQIGIDADTHIFYKPHGMGNEIFLQNLINKICMNHGWKNHRKRILDRGTYGWEEEVPYAPCRHEEEVRCFYQKSGMLAAVSYVLGIGDLHYENIIADEDEPVIIDAETLFQYMNPIYQWDEKAAAFYSVLSSGLFPGGNVGKNVSGIIGGEGELYEREVPMILNDQTSEMRVGYGKPRLKKGKNRVQCGNECPDISQYADDIIYGFDITYQWFLENCMQVMAVLLERENELYSRYISGATQFFGMGISASTHPQLLRERSGRAEYLDKITSGRRLSVWEKEAMLEGDIPWFGRHMNDLNLYSGPEIVCRDFFGHTLLEELKQRFGQLSYEDNVLQQKALKLSIDVFQDEKSWINAAGERILDYFTDMKGTETISAGWGKERFLRATKGIAEEIMHNAIRRRGKIFWLSMSSIGEQKVIKPVDYYFYSGISGIAVFFRGLCRIYPEYGGISIILEKMLFSYTDKVIRKEIVPDTQYTGIYCGEGSVAYAYQLLYQITDDEKYLFYAGKHLQALGGYIEKDRRFDLLYGNAGLILVLCQQYQYTKDFYYKKEAYRALEVLERNCKESKNGAVWEGEGNKNSVCSIAHGNSGILMAYARMNSIEPDSSLIKRMKQIVSFENQFYDEMSGNWEDLRKKGDDAFNTYAWCNGGLGILYARMWATRWNPEEMWLKEEVAEKVIPLYRNMRVREGMCLCHGNMGNYLIMKEIDAYLSNTEMNNWLELFSAAVFSELERDIIPRMPQEKWSMGLMNGLSGLGLAFVRQAIGIGQKE